jgi:hypothetical protein
MNHSFPIISEAGFIRENQKYLYLFPLGMRKLIREIGVIRG